MKWFKESARERTVRILTFDELNEEQKEKVIDKMREGIAQDDYDSMAGEIVDELQGELESKYGINDAKIRYSGFWSQGDGASIDSSNIDVSQFLAAIGQTELLTKLGDAVDLIDALLVRGSSNYAHSNTVSADVLFRGDSEEEEAVSTELNTLEQLLNDFQHSKAEDIYKQLEELFSDIMSDEHIIETIEANEYEFNEDTLGIE